MRQFMVLAAMVIGAVSAAAQEAESVRNVGDWEIYTRVDPFTEATHVHATVAVDAPVPVGIEAVAVSCNGADGSLSGTVFHSFMIGAGDENLVGVRFGTAEPREMTGLTFDTQDMTDFEVRPVDLRDFRASPIQLAVRFVDGGDRNKDGNEYLWVWSDLEGTVEALDAIEACLDGAPAREGRITTAWLPARR